MRAASSLAVAALATLVALPAEAQRRGEVQRVTASSPREGVVAVRVEGRNPCGAVMIDYDDGQVITHPIERLPVTIEHGVTASDTYRLRVTGQGNCDGDATTTITVRVPPAPRERAGRGQVDPARFAGMDSDNDGVITRAEWRGSARSFAVHDWNGDGVLSGDEVRPQGQGEADDEWREDINLFSSLDLNRDGFVSPAEWRWSSASFDARDWNGDGRLSARELADTPADGQAGEPTIRVSSRASWSPTGVIVREGDLLRFTASGAVRLHRDDGSEVATPGGSPWGRVSDAAPLPWAPVGALIGRIGSGAPFLIGDSTGPIRADASGELRLGVNDDRPADTIGAFQVVIHTR